MPLCSLLPDGGRWPVALNEREILEGVWGAKNCNQPGESLVDTSLHGHPVPENVDVLVVGLLKPAVRAPEVWQENHGSLDGALRRQAGELIGVGKPPPLTKERGVLPVSYGGLVVGFLHPLLVP